VISIARGVARTLVAGSLVAAAVVALGGSAGAVDVTFNCKAFALDANGQPTGNSLSDISQAVPIDISAPASVAPGAVYNAVSPSRTSVAPSVSPPPTNLPISEIKNLSTVIEVTGAAAIGTPTLAGGNILDATATVSGNLITITFPGTQAGSTQPGGTNFIPGGGSYTTPEITIPITAGAVGSQISFVAKDFTTNSTVQVNATTSITAGVRQCAPSGNTTVASTQVLAEGSPLAVDDTAETQPGQAVTIQVRANDAASTTLALDETKFAIVTPPTKGTATIAEHRRGRHDRHARVHAVLGAEHRRDRALRHGNGHDHDRGRSGDGDDDRADGRGRAAANRRLVAATRDRRIRIDRRRFGVRASVEDRGAPPVDDHSMFQVQAEGLGEHDGFEVPPAPFESGGIVAV
jgi:hypothetical protein